MCKWDENTLPLLVIPVPVEVWILDVHLGDFLPLGGRQFDALILGLTSGIERNVVRIGPR
jgi:hypothetical protein